MRGEQRVEQRSSSRCASAASVTCLQLSRRDRERALGFVGACMLDRARDAVGDELQQRRVVPAVNSRG